MIRRQNNPFRRDCQYRIAADDEYRLDIRDDHVWCLQLVLALNTLNIHRLPRQRSTLLLVSGAVNERRVEESATDMHAPGTRSRVEAVWLWRANYWCWRFAQPESRCEFLLTLGLGVHNLDQLCRNYASAGNWWMLRLLVKHADVSRTRDWALSIIALRLGRALITRQAARRCRRALCPPGSAAVEPDRLVEELYRRFLGGTVPSEHPATLNQALAYLR